MNKAPELPSIPSVFINLSQIDLNIKTKRKAINTHLSRIAQRHRKHKDKGATLTVIGERDITNEIFPPKLRAPLRSAQKDDSFLHQPQICAPISCDLRHLVLQGSVYDLSGAPSPTSILRKGNSDPFDSMIIPIDSTVNYLLAFNRDCVLPSFHHREIDERSDHTSTYWANTVYSLDKDQCQAYGFLARFAALHACLTRFTAAQTHSTSVTDWYIRAMTYKGRASKLLRSQILGLGDSRFEGGSNAESRIGRSEELCWSIYALLTAEFATRNFENAVIHGKMLRQLLQPEDRSLEVQYDSRLLHAALYNDIQRSSVSLTRPCFDLDRWEATNLRATWDELLGPENVSSRPRHPLPIDESLQDEPLRLILARFRELLEMYWLVATSLKTLSSSVIRLHLSTLVLLCEGRLINHYLATSNPISLGIIYWLRRVAKHESLGMGSMLSVVGCVAYDAGPAILSKLRRIFQTGTSEKLYVDKHMKEGMKNRLWLMYVGGLAERASREVPPRLEFQNSFLQQAKSMGYSWQSVREQVLKGFLYVDGIDSAAHKWFEEELD